MWCEKVTTAFVVARVVALSARSLDKLLYVAGYIGQALMEQTQKLEGVASRAGLFMKRIEDVNILMK